MDRLRGSSNTILMQREVRQSSKDEYLHFNLPFRLILEEVNTNLDNLKMKLKESYTEKVLISNILSKPVT